MRVSLCDVLVYRVSDGNMQLKPSVSTSGGALGSGEPLHMCPYCNYSSVNEVRIKAHVQSQHSTSAAPPATSSTARTLLACPLCQEKSADKATLENHLMQVHSASRDGLQKLMMLVEPVVEAPAAPVTAPTSSPTANSTTDTEAVDPVAEMIESQALKMAEEGEMLSLVTMKSD